ncbi:MAG: 23S rRNA (uracil(1939)-C(5))-methyltransferase RlmD [Clostridiales bacterium]|jgi:23S rRNA (uracil-5-)-methyltransferase RumA|nr:23S rRNA (uracil(1939)-C(5))-methyltransferase RlmD [Clostridiales bacterium]
MKKPKQLGPELPARRGLIDSLISPAEDAASSALIPRGGASICEDFPRCAGCAYQHISYEYEARLKEQALRAILTGPELPGRAVTANSFEGLVPSPSAAAYRNKMEYSFGDSGKDTQLELGMRVRGRFYEVVTSKCCNIVDADFRAIVSETLNFFRRLGTPFYRKTDGTGTLRNLIIRKGFFTNEILVNLVTTPRIDGACPEEYAARLSGLRLGGHLRGILHTINSSPADAVKCDALRALSGDPFLTERLCGLTFKISPFSFFQTNSECAQKLYETVRDFARPRGKIAYDLYCGTGVIAQILAKDAAHVTGVELLEEAVEAAGQNAALNGVANCAFAAGDVLAVLDKLGGAPDLIVLDPPRDGVNPRALRKIIALDVPEIVYVSCNPQSLVRDIAVFAEKGYTVSRARGHDMFPRTGHVETVALLTKA